jgi:hypothetical protein
MVCVCPGKEIVITPPNTQLQIEGLSSVTSLVLLTVIPPGLQGLGVLGTQGIGVSTPMAAEVAEATVGLAIDMQVPKGMMFTIGLWSMMVADGWLATFTRRTGSTTSVEGAAPKLHISFAPFTTWIGIAAPSAPPTSVCAAPVHCESKLRACHPAAITPWAGGGMLVPTVRIELTTY